MSRQPSPELSAVLGRLEGVERSGEDYVARCPAHDDRNPSLSATDGDTRVLLTCHANCAFESIVGALGMTPADLIHARHRDDDRGQSRTVAIPSKPSMSTSRASGSGSKSKKSNARASARDYGKHEAYYVYEDEQGQKLFRVERRRLSDGSKTFRQHAFDGSRYLTKMDLPGGPKARRVLYRLPAVREACDAGRVVFVVEGEKDVHTLEALGLTATTHPGGAGKGKWQDDFAESLKGAACVAILPDNDEAGADHALTVARSCAAAGLPVRIVTLPGLPDKGDASDWVEAGGTEEQLRELVRLSAPFDPSAQPDEPEAEEKKSRDPSALDVLEQIAEGCLFFAGEDGESYVRAPRPSIADGGTGGSDTVAVRGRLFSDWLRSGFFRVATEKGMKRKAPTGEAFDAAISTFDARAKYAPDLPGRHRVFLRTAGVRDETGRLCAIYVDLANEAGQYVAVTPGAWTLTTELPDTVHLLRTPSQLALPTPDANGTLADFLPMMRPETPGERTFILAWLVFSFHPFGPYPVLVLGGPHGSGKSYATEELVRLIDNRAALLRRPFKNAEDLFVHAKSAHVVALENLSSLSDRQSDDLCSVSTGAGIGSRTHYTNAEETAYTVCRPIVANGITSFVTRGDLASRTLKANLLRIDERERITKEAMNREVERLRPSVLGGVMNALAEALLHPDHTPDRLPRMADAAAFIDAAAPAFPEGTPSFLEALRELNARLASEQAEASGLATALIGLAEDGPQLTPEQDLTTWVEQAKSYRSDGQTWPKNAQAMRDELRRVDGVLRAHGVTLEPAYHADGRPKKDSRTRRALYRLDYDPPPDSLTKPDTSKVFGKHPSHPSHPSHPTEIGPEGAINGDPAAKDWAKDQSEGLRIDPSHRASGDGLPDGDLLQIDIPDEDDEVNHA